jgi:glycerol uptake facilitator protein
LTAELIGTAILVQVGCGANCLAIYLGVLDGMWQAAIVWILGATLGLYSSAALSGGHLNPAVTLSFAVVRPADFPYANVLPYWAAQLAGAFLGALTNLIVYHEAILSYEAKNGIVRGAQASIQSAAAFGDYWSLSKYVTSGWHAFLLEAFGTAFLVFCIFMLTNKKNSVPSAAVPPLVAIAIGSMVVLLGPMTGAGINPARDMGPRLATLVAGWRTAAFANWIVYFTAPLMGGPIGALIADRLLMA